MDKSIERIDQLVELWLDGSTTDAEEHELRSLVEACSEALPARLVWVATAFGGFEALSEERNPQSVHRPLYAHRQPLRPLQRVAVWALSAAAVVALAIAISIDREPYCYINGKAIYNAQIAMNETRCFEHLDELDQTMQVLTLLENLNNENNLEVNN